MMRLIALAAAIAVGARSGRRAGGRAGGVTFTDVTAAAGIKFTHNSGRAGKKYLPETLGSGGAFFDVDGDGWPDILLVNSKDWTPRGRRIAERALSQQRQRHASPTSRAGSGLDVEMYGIGVAVGDYDNDGRDDVYITALEGDRLFHNEGDGKFTRRDEAGRHRKRELRHERRLARLRQGRQARSVRRQLRAVDGTDATSGARSTASTKSYCTPESYKGTSSKLFHNLGGGKFEDVEQEGRRRRSDEQVARRHRASTTTATAGPTSSSPTTRSRTSCTATTRTARSPTTGMGAGVAYSEDGVARGAMGADAADYDRSGRPHLLVGNFSNQMLGLYHNEGNGAVRGRSAEVHGRPREPAVARVRRVLLRLRPRRPARTSSRPTATSRRRSAACSRRCSIKEPPLLFRNAGQRQVRERERRPSARRSRGRSSRAAPPTPTSTTTATSTCSSRRTTGRRTCSATTAATRTTGSAVRTRGVKSNRDGIGAVVRVDERVRQAVEHRPQRIELRVAERSARSPSAWAQDTVVTVDRRRVAERDPRQGHGCSGRRLVTIEEGKGIVPTIGGRNPK